MTLIAKKCRLIYNVNEYPFVVNLQVIFDSPILLRISIPKEYYNITFKEASIMNINIF